MGTKFIFKCLILIQELLKNQKRRMGDENVRKTASLTDGYSGSDLTLF